MYIGQLFTVKDDQKHRLSLRYRIILWDILSQETFFPFDLYDNGLSIVQRQSLSYEKVYTQYLVVCRLDMLKTLC